MKNLYLVISIISLVSSCSETVSIENETAEFSKIDTNTMNMDATLNTTKEIEFTSIDGLKISGLIYQIDETSPAILLCHQARFNLHEYDEIGPKLNALGFNCIAIDQRSGGTLNDFPNQTADRAIAQELPVAYTDAEQDIIAGINFA